jgi:hypothetical protein
VQSDQTPETAATKSQELAESQTETESASTMASTTAKADTTQKVADNVAFFIVPLFLIISINILQ